MELGMKGRVALVTGAGQGVGREISKVLASEGVKVAVNDLFQEKADKVATEIKQAGGIAIGVKADVTDLNQVKAMVARVFSELGSVDILVNNAGVPNEIRTGEIKRTVFAGSEPIVWKKQIDLNMYGMLNCVHSVLPAMIEKKHGKILSIISEAGRMGEAHLAVYSGAKAGMLGFTKALAREVGKYCINVNCVAIGATAHEAIKNFLDPDATPETDPILAKILKVYPIGKGLGRIGRPFDPAYAIAFLASPKSEFVTGQCLSVSGGFSMVS